MGPSTVTGIKPAPGCRFPATGFTMIELLIVMTLIIILASISMVQYRNSVTRAEEAALKENLFRMRDAMDQFYADKNKWPADLAELVSAGYIREVPTDPLTKSKETWQTRQAQPDPNNPASAGGIDNVHSGSDRTALDGTRYAEWD
ncbi:MAG: prepilin-type N-terminal cleavage/methylation domain-containing protein [Cyanobacteria bacterium]|nr:prepilin-type N-terminal cleavage/methylation domain-containing protein [Cyanobacteriota bacterium]